MVNCGLIYLLGGLFSVNIVLALSIHLCFFFI